MWNGSLNSTDFDFCLISLQVKNKEKERGSAQYTFMTDVIARKATSQPEWFSVFARNIKNLFYMNINGRWMKRMLLIELGNGAPTELWFDPIFKKMRIFRIETFLFITDLMLRISSIFTSI